MSPAGEYFRYGTYGSTLAGAIIEKVTGQPYATAMRKEMFEPLGMSRSFVEADEKHLKDLALGYGFVGDRYVSQPYEVYVTTPASSVDATPADMGRLLEALTGDGANTNGRFLSPQTARTVLAPQFRPHPEFLGLSHGLRESYARGGGGVTTAIVYFDNVTFSANAVPEPSTFAMLGICGLLGFVRRR